MKFGPLPVAQAEGAVLAHAIALHKGKLKKGSVLTAEDLAKLTEMGLSEIIAAQLEPGDLFEDAAAEKLARALVPDADRAGLTLGRAATGRVNITAQAPGVVEILPDRIHALNALHPMITVATVPEWQRVDTRSMVATVKIISYAVPQAALEAACLAGQSALRLRPVTCQTADLIQTTVDGTEPGDKGHRVTQERLNRMGATLGAPQIVPHKIEPLAEAIRASSADMVLILTGSATSDLHDVAPEALRMAGGEVTHYGMPVDPGNLLFFGSLQECPVIGLPGCARSPALNGADWVLERLLCGVPVTPRDIAGMGVGGLLKEIPVRGRLREA
ncbi:molybdopterin-binding protein [Tropicibacter naphthalenivorans]|uniref:Putative molybdopterin biosynthesis protein MoeA/LysR substrate binding-domain-containing protein n=1 Tax=Tropicibacter naphthalenivorans TaxID=441103 RepID=A0A0P1GFR5_9RHOB|nr:molybdopterin-binding protein [Tropicibacter naphthalenivorans]CUH80379.1 putative molybdopterin biosynthesis protein MoeA/LysR substrate binding-domain-containing protein [Tropicibacter naphthalenivorans]SMC86044.1 molybdenum cofactor cytidylyltransferase [Tropicibacter naphthalenivorans]